MTKSEIDYEKIARNFIKIERGLREDPSMALDQLLNIAKRDATWQSATKSTKPEDIQRHYDILVETVRRILGEEID